LSAHAGSEVNLLYYHPPSEDFLKEEFQLHILHVMQASPVTSLCIHGMSLRSSKLCTGSWQKASAETAQGAIAALSQQGAKMLT